MGATNSGLAIVTAALGTTYYIAIGTGTTAYAATQTALVTESVASGLTRAAATVAVATTTATNDTLQCSKTFTSGATATITETGVFNASSGATMMARTVLSTPRALVSGDQHTVVYKLVYSV
jgi:hypothetical protein